MAIDPFSCRTNSICSEPDDKCIDDCINVCKSSVACFKESKKFSMGISLVRLIVPSRNITNSVHNHGSKPIAQNRQFCNKFWKCERERIVASGFNSCQSKSRKFRNCYSCSQTNKTQANIRASNRGTSTVSQKSRKQTSFKPQQ